MRYPRSVTGERRYDDREVALILKRVVELQEREGGKSDARAMTEREIEQVVGELGLSTALVRKAAAELAVQEIRNRPVWWLGGKTDLMFEEVVPGHVDEASLGEMLEVLRRHLGDPGELEVQSNARIWSTSQSMSRRIHFSVVEHEDETTLRLEEAMPVDARATVGLSTVGGWFAGLMSVIPLKVLVIKSVLMMALGPLMAAGAVGGWLGGRAVWKRLSGKRERQLRRAFGEIVDLAVARPKKLTES